MYILLVVESNATPLGILGKDIDCSFTKFVVEFVLDVLLIAKSLLSIWAIAWSVIPISRRNKVKIKNLNFVWKQFLFNKDKKGLQSILIYVYFHVFQIKWIYVISK